MQIQDPAIPFDSVVVVIGANGFIAVETCEKVLQAGFRVRGTVRDVEKCSEWMHGLFDTKWPGKFELVQVEDFEQEGAFDEAFKGAAGVIYVSVPMFFDPDPSKVLNPMVKATINTLEAAAKAGVQRYTLSSSSKAVETAIHDDKIHRVTPSTYNYNSILKVSSESKRDDLEWIFTVYSAGRTLAELSFWSWVEQHTPPFVANSVVPDGNFGRGLHGVTSTNGQLKSVLSGEWQTIHLPLTFSIDVEDTARLLVAATVQKSVNRERILAYSKRSTWNELRHKVRVIRPDLVKGEDQVVAGHYWADSTDATRRAEEILKEVGQPGFVTEEAVLGKFVASFY